MPGITSLFYPDERSHALEDYFQSLPTRIIHTIKLFEQTSFPKQTASIVEFKQKAATLDVELRKFKGDVEAKSINLKGIDGKQYQLNDFKGKVTLVNFWATWCPPCVKEIPSLNHLQAVMDHPDFRMISVNYVEEPETIRKFIKQIEVEFPILLDRSGEVARDWKVIVFPSTFIIGPDGKIIYGVNAAINWDSDETINQLKNLLPAKL
jgi:peroxiredoxin